ncbi:Putative AMP-dependent synthetase/ligase, short-chain dehydrogenase/reductase SDR, ANL [Septoria linicola]|uniref:AMP-dependent synthetase/ligase, short-chain dehydrogenase/reductase SDR, ANL n=1 Tax=Septoria linicola TaxID=215465 RepID=A0A9Q9B3F1_9PEZI|nr:Putative AMP-dependent synthetase/ligase, short-chain dehydrogenase/reductase SDR, ANL [Septoria linicola]
MLDHDINDYGRRLLNHVVDERAAADHKRPYASIPLGSTAKEGFRDVSYATFANAINACATWLKDSIGTSSHEDTIAYIGPADMRYHILALAAVKTGHVMFFPSPRNTLDALDSLFEQAGVCKIISPIKLTKLVETIVQRRSVELIHIEGLDHFLDAETVPPIAFTGTFEQYRYRPWVKLHTSGSTGTPKVVEIKHGLVSAVDAYHLLDTNEVPSRYGNMRVFIPFPPFHLAGLNYSLPVMLWLDSTAVFPPVGAMITAELVHDIHTHGRIEHSMLAPSLIGELAKNDAWRPDFSGLKGLTYSGGPLSDEVADIVSEYTKITSSMGATEYGGIPMLPKPAGQWKYFRFNEDAAGLEFRETEQAGLFELVFVRQQSTISNLIQAIFVTFPDLDEYHTKDCFTKHPSEPGLWKYEMRLDDVLVLSNGEKFNPVPMEGLITSSPAVKGCLVVGQGKFQTALLVEPQDQDISPADLHKELQPFIDRANKLCPAYGRLAYDMLILTSPTRPLPRAAKGTVQRSHAVRAYSAEIEAVYSQDVQSSRAQTSAHAQLDFSSSAATEASVLEYLNSTLELEGSDKLRAGDDFFETGMDSLQVISLTRAINSSRSGKEPINPMFVYDHPTAEKLAHALATGARVKEYSDFDEDDEEDKQTWQSMEDLFQELRPEKSGGQAKRLNLSDMLRSSRSSPLYQTDGGMIAWRQVIGSFLINLNNWGLINSFGVYQAFYETGFLQSYSPSSIAWIGTVQGTLLLVVGVISGPLFDKGYFRATLILAGLGLVTGLMMLSLATEYYQIMLSQGVLVGICCGLLYIPSVALVPLYFKAKRGLALGLATAGGSVGGVVYPIVFRRLLAELGFGWAVRATGFISLVTLACAVVLIRPIGARSTRRLLDSEALRDIPFVSFMAAGFLLFAGVLVPYFLVTIYASGELGTSTDLSFYMLAILNGAQFFGRIIPAILSDWIGPELILLVGELLAGILGFCWIAVNNNAGYIVWLIVYGFTSGIVVTLPPAVLPYICPSLAIIGTRLGMLYAVAGIGFLISSPVALAVNQTSAGYLGSQVWIGACCIAAAAFYIVTMIEARKRRLLYEDGRVTFDATPDESALVSRRVLITGGVGGIGEACCRRLVAAGAYVVIADYNEAKGKALAAELASGQTRPLAKFIQVDVTSWESQLALFKTALAFFPGDTIDTLITCAAVPSSPTWFPGPAEPGKLDEADLNDIPRPVLACLDVNLIGTMYSVHIATTYCMDDSAAEVSATHSGPAIPKSIVLLGSTSGFRPLAGKVDYSVTKWAIRGLFRNIRSVLPQYGIRINMMAPFWVPTPLTQNQVPALERAGVKLGRLEDVMTGIIRMILDEKMNGKGNG